jgi:hypothetical protein
MFSVQNHKQLQKINVFGSKPSKTQENQHCRFKTIKNNRFNAIKNSRKIIIFGSKPPNNQGTSMFRFKTLQKTTEHLRYRFKTTKSRRKM